MNPVYSALARDQQKRDHGKHTQRQQHRRHHSSEVLDKHGNTARALTNLKRCTTHIWIICL